MKARPCDVVWRALLNAAIQPVGLFVGGLALSVAGVVGSSSLAAAGVAVYSVAAVVGLARPRLWREAVAQVRRMPADLPFAGDLQEAGARALLARLTAARRAREWVFGALSPPARAGAQPLGQRLIDLEESVLHLLATLDRLDRHLAVQPPAPLRATVERLGRLAAEASSRAAAGEFLEARDEVERSLRSVEDTALWRDLVVARLETMLSVLETLPWRTARLDLRQATARALAEEGTARWIGEELDAIEQAVTPSPPSRSTWRS